MQKGDLVQRSSKKSLESKEDDGEFIVAPGGRHTSEYDFWAHFLGLVSPSAQTEFIRRVNITVGGKISWDFWTGNKNYASALKLATETIKTSLRSSDYTFRQMDILQDFATRVCTLRKSQLDPKSPMYKKHLAIYEKWMPIRDGIIQVRAVSNSLTVKGGFLVGYLFSFFKYAAVFGGLGYSFWLVALNSGAIYK